MGISIKRISEQDVDTIAFLFDEYRQFYKQPTDISAAASFLKERLSRNESVVFIADADELPVGFMQLYPIFSSVGLKRAWLLNDLYVAANTRKHGVGKLLLEAAKQFGKETGSRWLLLQTGADNTTAQSVYERNGWVRETDFFYRMDL
ncbi:MAG: GNAT family N-acetyltransferase [Sphingobacteriales bacterium]|nr:MAG: GNAT family N-acetyltransferase [Sphingobacteriales bacterium]